MSPLRLCHGLTLTAALLVGCSSSDGGPDGGPDLSGVGGKSDLVDLSVPLAFDEEVTGDVGGSAFVLFRLEGDHANDKIQIEVRKTGGSGQFDPRADAFNALGSDIDHDPGSFERFDDGSRKTVTFGDFARDPFIAVSAHNGAGDGSFSMVVTCVDGPCTGFVPPNQTEATHAAICIENARACAMEQTAGQGVDADGARAALSDCLATVSGVEDECGDVVCDGNDDSREVCEQIVSAIAFYSDESAACRSEVEGCLESCLEREENSPFLDEDEMEFFMTGTARCWQDPNFFGTCDEYAREHESCGGSEHAADTDQWNYGSCFTQCEAVEGPWMSEVDETCDPHCIDEVCVPLEIDCNNQCQSDDPDCVSDCISADPRNDTHTGLTCSDVL